MQKFMELDMKKFTGSKTLTLGVWGLKTKLGQFGTQNIWQRTYQAISQEPCLQYYHKQDLIFSRIMRLIQ